MSETKKNHFLTKLFPLCGKNSNIKMPQITSFSAIKTIKQDFIGLAWPVAHPYSGRTEIRCPIITVSAHRKSPDEWRVCVSNYENMIIELPNERNNEKTNWSIEPYGFMIETGDKLAPLTKKFSEKMGFELEESSESTWRVGRNNISTKKLFSLFSDICAILREDFMARPNNAADHEGTEPIRFHEARDLYKERELKIKELLAFDHK